MRHLNFSIGLTIFTWLSLWGQSCFAQIETSKVALIIGNSSYEFVPQLANPANDASDIADVLERLEFEVTLLTDQDDAGMRAAIREFSRSARRSDLSLVYYAGHGIEIDKQNFLIPTNARLDLSRDAELEAVNLSDLLSAVSGGKGVSLVLVDACRDNPFAANLLNARETRSIGTGLARVNPDGGVLPGGVLISYAAREGEYALDGDGRNSPYASGILEHLEQPGLEVSKFFRKVRDSVFIATDGFQEPFTYGSLPGKDIFLSESRIESSEEKNVEVSVIEQVRSGQSLMLEDFGNAQDQDTIQTWARFIETYGDDKENPLVKTARINLRELGLFRGLDAGARKTTYIESPWFVPVSALDTTKELSLTQDERKRVQSALNFFGLDTGGIDGHIGPKSKAAIHTARLRLGLPASEEIDVELANLLPDPKLILALKNDSATKYDKKLLDPRLEPRLRRALSVLDGFPLKFGYFRGKLYLVVQNRNGGNWAVMNRLAYKAGGQLVTINSREENDFIVNLFSSNHDFAVRIGTKDNWFGPTIGLFQIDGAREPDGGWSWVSGEPLEYQNWGGFSPDDWGGGESFATFFSHSKDDPSGMRINKWNDVSIIAFSFIIEID